MDLKEMYEKQKQRVNELKLILSKAEAKLDVLKEIMEETGGEL